VSHSHRRIRRRWNPNIQTKTYFLPSQGRRITLRVSANGIKVIDRDGIDAGPHSPQWREDLMARNDIRPVVKLRSRADMYLTRKNRPNDPDGLVLRKYDPVERRHIEFREEC
jgi:ribosomal protein L28/ribosomal protein L33